MNDPANQPFQGYPSAGVPQSYQESLGHPSNTKERELEYLKQQASLMREGLDYIQKRIQELSRETKSISGLQVYVDANRCNACGACANICPQEAVTISDIAEIDRSRCTVCGVCVYACPRNALVLRPVRGD